MSDTVSHFKNHMMAALEKSLGVDRKLSVANSPWPTLKAMIQEDRRNTQDWVKLVPAVVQWALNTAFRKRYGPTPFHVMFGRAPRTALSTLASLTGQDWQVDMLDNKTLRKKVQSLVEAQSEKEVLDKVQANRDKQREGASRGNMPNFAIGEYVLVDLVARLWRCGSTPKLLMTWTGPWRVVVAQRPHVYGVQNIVSGEVRDVHVARMCFYADAALAITTALKVFQHAFTQGDLRWQRLWI